MSNPHAFLSTFLNRLPADWHESVQALADEILQADKPLRLVLLGGFSVGKSSLLNMMLQEPLLQAALEETTALPTFIEYSPDRSMKLVNRDGSVLPLDEQQFAQVTTQAPQGAACATLGLAQDWLKGISIIDLPGLGSTSVSHREYTLAQVRQADAVLYLLNPRGPSSADMEILKVVQQSGKRVKVLVTHWDEVQAAVHRGEREPSLEQWASQIETATGLRTRVAPSDSDGLARDDILAFVQRAREDLDSIRLRRFQAELRPMLHNALGYNAEQQHACQADSEAQAQALHVQLVERKQRLADFKAGLYEDQQADRGRMSEAAALGLRKHREQLELGLAQCLSTLAQESEWELFGQRGNQQLASSVQMAARLFSELSQQYGILELLPSEVADFNLRLPPPETVSPEDFLDFGRMSQLQQALDEQQKKQQFIAQQHANLEVQDMSEAQQALHALDHEHNLLASQPLAMVVQQTGGGGVWLGRILGEIADVGLMFVNPTVAGAKVAALIGKGAKVAKIAVNTGKVAKAIATGVKVAKGVQQGSHTVKGVPRPVMDKLAGLEMLSLSYWGERVGRALGGPVEVEVVDTQAMAERDLQLAQWEQQRQHIRRALARNEDITNERNLTGWELEQNQQQQVQLQDELEQLKANAERAHLQALQHLQQERLVQVHRSGEKAVTHWLQGFDRQAASMDELLHVRVRSYWEDRVEALLNERINDIDDLTQQVQASAQDKQALLVELREQAKALTLALETLH